MLFGKLGECIGGHGLWFRVAANANNVTESQALVEVLHYVEEVGALGEPLMVLGDSELTINFMNRKCTPGKLELVAWVKEAMNKLHWWWHTGQPKVRFCHLDRA